MRVLLTGASSFSGYWIAVKLHAAGLEVVAPLRGSVATYDGIRRERIECLAGIAEVVQDCSFGSPAFMDLIESRSFDALSHHAARVADYRSLDFDVVKAVAENTNNIRSIVERMAAKHLRAVVFTGSVFEANEGTGNFPMQAFSPYGLSKGLTSEIIRHWCIHYRIPFKKFLIANPFGPYEEPRFCAYLIKTWRKGVVAEVRTPSYLRDNIHVDLLALAYSHYVRQSIDSQAPDKLGPMGYAETQGGFAERFAAAMRSRLGWACNVKLLQQTDFSEPLARINTHPIDAAPLGWSEPAAWDAIADFYRHRADA
jgi:UDP-glucose 4-epimerase